MGKSLGSLKGEGWVAMPIPYPSLLGKKRFATSPYRMGEPLLLDDRHSFIDITAPNIMTQNCFGGRD
jgi:hypothetical protein